MTTVAMALAGPVRAAHPTASAAWAGYVVAAVLSFALVLAAIYACWSLGRNESGGSDSNDGGDDGGGRRPTPPPNSPSGPGQTDPEWWPEFERQFAAHVAGPDALVRGRP